MLMRNSNTGAFELYDISNNQLTSAAPMGQVGLEWQVAGFGPINGAGTSDMLMRDSNNGAFEFYYIANNQLVATGPMGQVGNEWSVAGIAADPPSARCWEQISSCRRWRRSLQPLPETTRRSLPQARLHPPGRC